jgi:FkbM family methyltransferase
MKTLEQEIAFNEGYRLQWRDYLDKLDKCALEERLDLLVHGMDPHSADVCRRHIELVPFLLPHAVSQLLYISTLSKRKLLSPYTVEALDKIGYFTTHQDILDKLHQELDLPEQPLPEMICHSGLSYIAKIARNRIAGSTVIDGGAYIGDTAKMILCHYKPSRIIAIEPEEGAYSRLCEAVRTWGLHDRINPIRRLLSDHDGEAILWGRGVGASTIRKVGAYEEIRDTVATTTIDSIVDQFSIGNLGLIKLDVEGSEYSSVLGAIKTIKSQRPILVISIYHTAKDFFEIKPLLEQHIIGYKYIIRKMTDDLMKEIVLIGVPQEVGC